MRQWTCLCALLVVSLVVPAAYADVNLVQNPSFEQGEGTVAPGWATLPLTPDAEEGAPVRSKPVVGTAKTGEYVCSLAATEKEFEQNTIKAVQSPLFPVEQGDDILVEAWVRVPAKIRNSTTGAFMSLVGFADEPRAEPAPKPADDADAAKADAVKDAAADKDKPASGASDDAAKAVADQAAKVLAKSSAPEVSHRGVTGWRWGDHEENVTNTSNEWQRIVLAARIDSADVKAVQVRLGLEGVGVVYFDDIVLYDTPKSLQPTQAHKRPKEIPTVKPVLPKVQQVFHNNFVRHQNPLLLKLERKGEYSD